MIIGNKDLSRIKKRLPLVTRIDKNTSYNFRTMSLSLPVVQGQIEFVYKTAK